MAERELCVLCEKRPSRRSCPGVHGEICALCCGVEREQTIDCPLDCTYLREARRHERTLPRDPATLPSPDVNLSDSFLQEKHGLMILMGQILLGASLGTPGAVDSDVREALDALARTWKTAQSGLIYTTRPANLIAAQIQERFEGDLQRVREQLARETGLHTIRDADVLGSVVFWQRLAWQTDNGRRKGRAFIERLLELGEPPSRTPQGSTSPIRA